MMFLEVFAPPGTFTPEQNDTLARRLVEELFDPADMAAATRDALRDWTRVVIHQPAVWYQGQNDAAPGIHIRASVPASWRAGVSPEYITRITTTVAGALSDAELPPHDCWVEVHGIAQGSLGVFGRVLPVAELEELMTRGFRESDEREALLASAGPGTAIDPICGTVVTLDDPTALREEIAGTVHGFCCAVCRDRFRAEVVN